MSYQNGASNGSGYQPIESSMSNGGKFGLARVARFANPKDAGAGVSFGGCKLRRCESGWMRYRISPERPMTYRLYLLLYTCFANRTFHLALFT